MHVTLPCEARANPNLVSGVARMESRHLRTSACPARDIPAIMVGAMRFAAWRNALRLRLFGGLPGWFERLDPPVQSRDLRCHSSETQIVERELADRGATHQLHVALYFGLHEAERPLDAGLAGRG
jgi:hypothetical protein